MNFRRYLFLVFSFLIASSELYGTHIVGGEMTYRCLGNNQYEVTLTVYRDCYNGIPWFDAPAYVAVYDANWNQVGPTYGFELDNSLVEVLPIELDNPCLNVPPDVCVQRTFYVDTLELAFSPGGYTLVYQRCCRNRLIRNTPDPLNTGISIVAEIDERALQVCNGGATFDSWPPVAICVNQPINFDHGATDPDGDSLVYRLCTPLNGPDSLDPRPLTPYVGPYEEIKWTTPPYDLNNLLGGDPLTINPNTGFMTGVPSTIGNFVVGVCVDEYRNDELISTTRRDFQYNVADCGKITSAFFVPEVICDTLIVAFDNTSFGGTNFKWFFDWPDTFNVSSVRFPIYFYPDTGSYTVALIVEPNTPCTDTAFQDIYITNSFIEASADYAFGVCDNSGLNIQAADLSIDTVHGVDAWAWTLYQNGIPISTSTDPDPNFLLPEQNNYLLQLIATAGNGCQDTVSFPVDAPVPPVSELMDEIIVCQADTVELFPNADTAFTYQWAPADDLSDPNAPNPSVFASENVQYTVTITGGGGPCVQTGTVDISVVQNSDVVQAQAVPDLLVPGATTQLEAFFPGAISYEWSPVNLLNDPNIQNPVATVNETTTFVVRAILSDGCDATGEVTVQVRNFSCEDPFVFFPNAFSPNGDGENDELKLEGQFVEEVYWVVYNRWGEKIFEANDISDAWDGTYQGEDQPAETYGYYLRVRCVGEQLSERKGNVTLLR